MLVKEIKIHGFRVLKCNQEFFSRNGTESNQMSSFLEYAKMLAKLTSSTMSEIGLFKVCLRLCIKAIKI